MYKSWALDPAAIEEEAVQEYVRCFRQAGAMRAAFDDYRAGASIDLEHDGADRDRKIAAPTLVLWAGSGRPGPWVLRERSRGLGVRARPTHSDILDGRHAK